jgi:ribonuclease R
MNIPSPEDVIEFLKNSSAPRTKREMVRAFGIKGDGRRLFNQTLRGLEQDGQLVKHKGGGYSVPDTLPKVLTIIVTEVTIDGDVYATPETWDKTLQGEPPVILISPDKKGHPSVAKDDRALVELRRTDKDEYEARIIRRLGEVKGNVMGMVTKQRNGYVLKPTDKRAKYDFDLKEADLNGAKDGDLVLAALQSQRGLKRQRAQIVEVIGSSSDIKSVSLISLHEAGLSEKFPDEVIAETVGMKVPDVKGREDLRDIPLVTIDGADARDFDDAVYAEKTTQGYKIIVAIADVAHYVRSGSPLDQEAFKRGNSTYFPDRVIPMLPEALSNDLCSLRPRENRACMAMHMEIDDDGKLLSQRVSKALMRSEARLIYEQVQAAKDGTPDDLTAPLMERVINPLYDAYNVLWKAREKRHALELDLPEKQILINDKNEMVGITQRSRLDAHKMIEEFMILANVAAARVLEGKKRSCVYRVHERPDGSKIDSVRDFIESFGLSLPKGQITSNQQINQILLKASELPYKHLIHQVLLRAQSQARYSPENAGHFGLALQRYAHFTSPIRRYADLIVHRSLAGLLTDGEEAELESICEHISATERVSAQAERSAVDRFTSAFMQDKVGATFTGRITGVTRAGLFIMLDETGADGLLPMRTLPDDYYVHDEKQHALIGRKSKRIYRLGAEIQVRIKEADPVSGGMIFETVNAFGADIPGVDFGKINTGGGYQGQRKKGNFKRKGPKKKGKPSGKKGKR